MEEMKTSNDGWLKYDGWQCGKSPTSAHHWVCQFRNGHYDLFRCKYCHTEKLFLSTFEAVWRQNRKKGKDKIAEEQPVLE